MHVLQCAMGQDYCIDVASSIVLFLVDSLFYGAIRTSLLVDNIEDFITQYA